MAVETVNVTLYKMYNKNRKVYALWRIRHLSMGIGVSGVWNDVNVM